jgi:hypothetical protein
MEHSSFAHPAAESHGSVVMGHSTLGTPMQPSVPSNPPGTASSEANLLCTSAIDLGALLARFCTTTSGGAAHSKASLPPSAALDMFCKLDHATPGGIGLGVRNSRTEHGQRVQLSESVWGVTCLMRWYPDSGVGVVALCNAANAQPAAERIAHAALGGE